MAKSIKTTSWINNHYDLFFYGLVRGLRPDKCVELGTYAGYSAYCIATALRDNGFGGLDCYDLWEAYPFNKVNKKVAEENLKGLPVRLHQENALSAFAHYKFNAVDLLLVDLSNDGLIYRKVLRDWKDRLSPSAIVLMEGGTEERDQVDWMVRYKKYPIVNELKDTEVTKKFNFNTLVYFPGLTIFTKK